jgi:hypothetical protein
VDDGNHPVLDVGSANLRYSRRWAAGRPLRWKVWLTISLAVFACILMVLPTNLDELRLDGGLSDLSFDAQSPATPTNGFYPYLVNTSLYPNPDTMASPATGYSYTLPQVATAVVDGVPTIYLLAVNQSSTGSGLIVLKTGVYSSALATEIANGTSSLNLPIQWSSWHTVDTITQTGPVCHAVNCYTHPPGSGIWTSEITGTALAVAPDGYTLYAAATVYGSTDVWYSGNGGVTWSGPVYPSPLENGFDPHFSFFGNDVALSVRTSDTVIVATFFLNSNGYGDT